MGDEKKHYKLKGVWMRTLTTSLGFFSIGYSYGIYNSSQKCVSSLFNWGSDSDLYISITSSVLPFGGFLGANLMGILSRKYGKRKNIMIADVIMLLGTFCVYYPNTISFTISRLLQGISSGALVMISSQYTNEFTPSDMTGRMGSLNQTISTCGLLFSYSICLLLPTHTCGNSIKFYVLSLFAPPGLVCLVQFLIFLKVYTTESPYWLVKNGQKDLALQSLAGVYNQSYVETQLEKIFPTGKNDTENEKELNFGYIDIICCRKKAKKSSRLGILFHCFHQGSGVGAILFYSTTIFERLGEGVLISRILTIVATLCRVLAIFVLFPVIDRSGRKRVTVISLFLMSMCFLTMALIMDIDGLELSLVFFIILFLVLFSISIGPIAWVYTSEILNDKGMSLCTSINWITSFAVILTFPIITDAIGINNVFFIYAGINLFASTYFMFDMVETKQMSKLEIKFKLAGIK